MDTTTPGVEDYDDYTDYTEYKAGLMIWKVVPPILIIVGTIGNILSILVLTRRSIRVSTTALYLTFLAFSDLCVLYTGLLRQWLIYLFEYDVRHVSNAGCKIHIWLLYTSLDFSAWILIAVTLERVISAWCPYSAKTKCSRKYATALVVAILIFLLGLNSHLLYGMVHKEQLDESTNATITSKCVEINDKYGDFFNLTWPWIDLCAFCLIPFSVIVIGNGFILFKVIKSQRKTKARIVPSINTGETRPSHRTTSKHSSMTAMLFTLNMVFLVTTSPVSIYNIGYTHWVSDGTHQTYASLDLWWAIVNMLMYTNNSLNFLLYCLSGTRFRQEVKRLFCSMFGQRSQTQVDIYTRTKFNTQIPTQTPSRTPDMEAQRRMPNTLPVPDVNHLVHSSDTSGFGSCNSLHPGSALNPTGRTTSMTGISLSNGGSTTLTCIDKSMSNTRENSPSPSTKEELQLKVSVSNSDVQTFVNILPNQPDDLTDENDHVPNNEEHKPERQVDNIEQIEDKKIDKVGKPNEEKLHNAEILIIPVISTQGDDGIDMVDECSV